MKVFTGSTIRQQLQEDELKALVADFRRYKIFGQLPQMFGRDSPYNHYNTPRLLLLEGVQHIHLNDGENPWPLYRAQHNKTSDKAHLVYCQGAINPDYYLFIAILSPDAHKQAKDFGVMQKLGTAAEKSRLKF